MNPISSRTPEGEPTQCPMCGKSAAIDFSSFPTNDAPCPHCGILLSGSGKAQKASPREMKTKMKQAMQWAAEQTALVADSAVKEKTEVTGTLQLIEVTDADSIRLAEVQS